MGQVEQPFNFFLSLLSSDRDTAEKKLKDIRRRLVIMLDCRGCACSEDLAHEAILRFTHRLPQMDPPFTGDPIGYLYTVAYNLYLEYAQKEFLPLPDDFTETPQPGAESGETKEQLHKCLDACLERMDAKNRELVLDYYRFNKQTKIDFRQTLAQQLGISANALRIRLHNIRGGLEECIERCLGLEPSLEME
jgi:RNA polymerase sigma factor (sigma-70 family)